MEHNSKYSYKYIWLNERQELWTLFSSFFNLMHEFAGDRLMTILMLYFQVYMHTPE